MNAFRGSLGIRIIQRQPADPEAKGLVERANGYLETSFLPGRSFVSPQDFNAQLEQWLGPGEPAAASPLAGPSGGSHRGSWGFVPPADHAEHLNARRRRNEPSSSSFRSEASSHQSNKWDEARQRPAP
jgi:hypothetical protein